LKKYTNFLVLFLLGLFKGALSTAYVVYCEWQNVCSDNVRRTLKGARFANFKVLSQQSSKGDRIKATNSIPVWNFPNAKEF
jgi:hypothetical protein